jgi:NAD+ synthase
MMAILTREPEFLTICIGEWIRDRVSTAGARGALLGLSGGIDSAVVAAILKKYLGNNMLAVMMPCHSQEEDLDDAMKIVEAFSLPHMTVDLTRTYDIFLETIEDQYNNPTEIAKANIKPRLRMTSLYVLAQSMGFLVCGTSNKAELTIGYFTKHGDSGADILPLGDLRKEEVFSVAEFLGVPDDIIRKPPSAGLWPGQTDEQEMGFTYSEIDGYLRGERISEKALAKIRRNMTRSRHKREMPPVCVIDKEDILKR